MGMGSPQWKRKTSCEGAMFARARDAGGHGDKPIGWADSSKAHWKVYWDPDKMDPESKSCG